VAPQINTADRKIGLVAEGAHGVATRDELLSAAVSVAEIKHRLRTGLLLQEYPGVYRVGHRAPSMESRYMAAVKACGEGAVLSGLAAGRLLGLIRGEPPPEVTTTRQRRPKGVKVRRVRRISPRDVTRWSRIPVTTPAATLVDLSSVLAVQSLARACHEAGIRHRTTPADVEAVLQRRPNSKGATELRSILRGDTRITLSRLESRFLELLQDNGLPLPDTNKLAGGRRVDCRWPRQRVTVELDGYTYHRSRHAWEQDRRREREAHARGDEFRRYTYGDVLEDPRPMLRELRPLLAPEPSL
jgi:very-short-patch-repair endonuclease